MGLAAGLNSATLGLTFAYDTGDIVNSYIGQPSTNLALFTMQGSFNADYAGVTFTDAPGKGYQGRDAKRIIGNSGQWNIYRYPRSGNYTNTSSGQFTFSFKIKWADGRTPYFSNGYIYVDAGTNYPAVTAVPIDDGWFWCYCTYNGTSSPPWLTGFSTSDNGTCWVCDWQLEPGLLHPTPYITPGGTRSVTQGLLPLTGSAVNLTDVSFNSSAQMLFDGTNDYINTDFTSGYEGTVELIIKCSNYDGDIPFSLDSDNYSSGPNIYFTSNGIAWNTGDSGDNTFSNSSYPNSNYHHLVITNQSSGAALYIDGVLIGTAAGRSMVTTGSNKLWLGRFHGGGYYFNGELPVVRLYNRPLNFSEIKDNYKGYKTRFNLT